jgi:5'-3' exonuclease
VTLALIDGDICAYRAAAVKTDGMEDESGCAGPPEPLHPAIATDIAANIVEQWMKKADCTTCIVAISGDHNFRKTIMPSYKSNRSGTAKPLHLSTVRGSLMNRFDHRVVDGLEADDLLGILAGRRGFEEAIIVSPDKDLLTIPGRHLNPFKDDPIVVTTEAQADYRWMLQTLMGDTSDGYSGIPKVGVKKAGVILQGLRTLPAMWRAVVAAYRDAKLPEAAALVTARVARILRTADYDKGTKEIVLWHPITPQRVALKEITQ